MATRVARIACRLDEDDVDNLAVVRDCLDTASDGDCGLSLTQLVCFCLAFTAEAIKQGTQQTHEESK